MATQNPGSPPPTLPGISSRSRKKPRPLLSARAWPTHFAPIKRRPLARWSGSSSGTPDPQQRAGVLNQLLGALGPGLLGAGAGGALGDLMRRLGGGSTVTPEQAQAITPEQVQEVAHRAEQQNPSIIDKVSDFYAQHPGLVKTLGSAALAIALARMAQRR